LAVQLKQLMDKGLKVDLNSLSRNASGNTDDGLPLNRELVGEIKVGENSLAILLDRVQRGKNPPIWLFSAETLLDVRELPVESARVSFIEENLPAMLVDNSFWGIAWYRWILVPSTLLLLALLAGMATRLLGPLAQRYVRPETPWGAVVGRTSFAGPARLLVFAVLMWLTAQFGYTLMTRQRWSHVALVLIALAMAWLFMRAINPVASGLVWHMRSTQQHHMIALVHLLRGLAKAIVVVTVLLVILSLQGVNLTAAVAGIGIGGLALAFAAQKTLENVFGTVMLVADQPIRVGDVCRLGDTMGVIEDIGLRSTRVRTVERTIVTVPNGQASSMIVENFAAREKMLFKHVIGLRYETTSDQLRHVLASVRKLLSAHPQVEKDSVRIRFVRFGGSSLDLETFCYLLATDLVKYLEIQEDLLLQIMDAVEASGTAMAFPSQTMYMAKDPGLDAARTDAAIAAVRQSRRPEGQPAAA
jgi:MscS family membrane protein